MAALGSPAPELKDAMEVLSGVLEVVRISRPYKLASREVKGNDTVIRVGNVAIGGDAPPAIMAGPVQWSLSGSSSIRPMRSKRPGPTFFAGRLQARTSPYSFRGLGEEGLAYLAQARDETGLPVITEVMTVKDVDLVYKYSDIIQIGTRNMQNFILLDEVGKVDKPVMLKRGLSGTIEEWLLAAEYILAQGNLEVILCERGIRTFETATRNTLDISAIPMVRKLSHLPVVSDPAHGTGKWYLVAPMALASVAAGAHGIMVEVHPSPDHAKSDGAQSLTFDNFGTLMRQIKALSAAVAGTPNPALAQS